MPQCSNEDAKLRRKVNKPLVEKRRRERINKYLYELHSLLTESGSAPPASKLEKADILEMAVNHIRNLKKQIQLKYSGSQYRLVNQTQAHRTHTPTEAIQISIPSRSYSPTGSVSSSNSDYPSPPACYQAIPQATPNVIPYQRAILQVQPGYALVIQGDNSRQQITNKMPTKPMWRPW